MKRTFTALALAGLIAGCGGSSEPTTRPGNPTVYQRIEQTTDCAKLQKEFDTASANHDRTGDPASTEYMAAADDRMREVGCY
jgi:hypothetical protein